MVEKIKNVRLRAYKFALAIIDLVKKFPKGEIYSVFANQLLRSATSVGANLIEARSLSSRKIFTHYYEIALRSCNETIYWLYLLRDGKLLKEERIKPLIQEATQISKMIASNLLTLRGKHKNKFYDI
jgi:four helix bundle protein